MAILVTGAGGFLGSHCLEHLLTKTSRDIVAIDSFRNRGKTDRISYLTDQNPSWHSRVSVITHDLAAPISTQMAHRIGPVDYVIAIASESHVDRSIASPVAFIRNNVELTLSTLEYCRQVQPKMVVWISTDEVYGAKSVSEEWAPILPSSPYAASKAAQEAIAISYWRTYGLPIVIVNCANLIGERQDAEKFLPLIISKILNNETVLIHGTKEEIGTRQYLHARNLADAILFIMTKLPAAMFEQDNPDGANYPDRYNVVIDTDCFSNLQLAQSVADVMNEPLHYDLVGFRRPGHDKHYGLYGAKLEAAGWKPPISFRDALERIVPWYVKHPEWLVQE